VTESCCELLLTQTEYQLRRHFAVYVASLQQHTCIAQPLPKDRRIVAAGQVAVASIPGSEGGDRPSPTKIPGREYLFAPSNF